MSSGNPEIFFFRHGLEYIANVGGDPVYNISLPIENFLLILGYDPSTNKGSVTKTAVEKFGYHLSEQIEDTYAKIFRKNGIDIFSFCPDVKGRLSAYITSVLCRDFQITD